MGHRTLWGNCGHRMKTLQGEKRGQVCTQRWVEKADWSMTRKEGDLSLHASKAQKTSTRVAHGLPICAWKAIFKKRIEKTHSRLKKWLPPSGDGTESGAVHDVTDYSSHDICNAPERIFIYNCIQTVFYLRKL